MILVDTDWVIDALNGKHSALVTLRELAPDGLALSVVSYGELYQGAAYGREPVSALQALHDFVDGKDLLPVTAAIAARFGILRGHLPRHLRQQIGDMDLMIAATALTHDLTLLTRNRRDFENIPDLELHHAP
jgi:predicted nucleic acid-binding protein